MQNNAGLGGWIAACAVVGMVMGMTPQILAQDSSEEEAATTGSLLLTTTTGVATTLIGGGIALTIVLANNNDDSSSKKEYIRQNAVALKQDLTIGSGESVRDLAAVFKVGERDYESFARVLRERRDTLVPLTTVDRLDEERAEQFFREIARGMQGHPKLRDDLREISFVHISEG